MLQPPNSLLELLQPYGTKITKADMIGGDYGRSWERDGKFFETRQKQTVKSEPCLLLTRYNNQLGPDILIS